MHVPSWLPSLMKLVVPKSLVSRKYVPCLGVSTIISHLQNYKQAILAFPQKRRAASGNISLSLCAKNKRLYANQPSRMILSTTITFLSLRNLSTSPCATHHHSNYHSQTPPSTNSWELDPRCHSKETKKPKNSVN